jgi:hypothetical protein
MFDSCDKQERPEEIEKLSGKEKGPEFDLWCGFLNTERHGKMTDKHTSSFNGICEFFYVKKNSSLKTAWILFF